MAPEPFVVVVVTEPVPMFVALTWRSTAEPTLRVMPFSTRLREVPPLRLLAMTEPPGCKVRLAKVCERTPVVA